MPWTPYKLGIKRFDFPSVAGQSGHEISQNFATRSMARWMNFLPMAR